MKTIAIYLQIDGVQSLTMSDEQAEYLGRLLPEWRVISCHTEEEFTVALGEATVACSWIFKQEWFGLAPELKLVATPAAGKDYFTVEWPDGMLHWNGAFHGRLMAESAVAMLLGMTRGLLPAVTTYGNLAWPRTEVDATMRPLRGSRVTICGFGKIGRWIGKLVKPFGARIWGVSAHEGHETPEYFDAQDGCYTVAQLDSLLPTTDHLVLVLPRSPETDGFLSAERLALMPRHATVSNLGRGNAIDEEALIAALTSGRLAGACLDVTAVEPLPATSPLRRCPNLWITPHSSAFGPDYMNLYADELAARLLQERL